MRSAIAVVLAVTLCLPLLLAAGDDPKDEAGNHIDQAKAAVDAGKYMKAADQLQQALGSLRDLTRTELERFHPDMGEGWAVEGRYETKGDIYYVVQAVRTYRKKPGDSVVEVSILVSRKFAAFHKEFYNLVELQEFQDMERDSETISADGVWEGYRRAPKGGPVTTVAYSSPLVVMVAGKDPALVSAVWEKIDFKRLRDFLAE